MRSFIAVIALAALPFIAAQQGSTYTTDTMPAGGGSGNAVVATQYAPQTSLAACEQQCTNDLTCGTVAFYPDGSCISYTKDANNVITLPAGTVVATKVTGPAAAPVASMRRRVRQRKAVANAHFEPLEA